MKKPTLLFWVIAALILLWNAFGCYLYLTEVTMTDVQYAKVHGDAMAEVRHLYPAWAMAAFALVVWGGLLGAILLLLRRGLCVTFFGLSLVAAIICFIPSFISAPMREAAGTTFWVMPVTVVLLGCAQLWFARQQRQAG